MSADLTAVSTADLEAVRSAIRDGRLVPPFSRAALAAAGLVRLEPHLRTIAGESSGVLATVLDAILAERARPRTRVELVWTGPDPTISVSRRTAAVVQELFLSAQREVLVAGFWFTKGSDIFRPLHTAMSNLGVRADLFLDVQGELASDPNPEHSAARTVERFLDENWKFGPPLPTFYFDPRTADPARWVKLHAKCVVVDCSRALVTSANFTRLGQNENIEVGVRVDDLAFATDLVGQFQRALRAGTFQKLSIPHGERP